MMLQGYPSKPFPCVEAPPLLRPGFGHQSWLPWMARCRAFWPMTEDVSDSFLQAYLAIEKKGL